MSISAKHVLGAVAVVLCTDLQAALIDRGGGLIYDSVLNVTWLKDANYAKTVGRSIDGSMTWSEAAAWASELNYTDTVRGVTYSDWRLPKTGPIDGNSFDYAWDVTGQSDYGYNIGAPETVFAGSTASEMAHLFYNSLNNSGLCDPVLSSGALCVDSGHWGLLNAGPFTNFEVGAGEYYWSSTDFAPQVYSGYAFNFSFHHGGQGGMNKAAPLGGMFTLLVREGDVASLPEPSSVLLCLIALGLMGVSSRPRAA